MAIDIKTVWEVRSSTGSDAYGGGYQPSYAGTDYSQQNSPHVTLDGLTISGVLSGSTLTLVGYSPASGDVGNVFNLTGGTGATAGFYLIISVNVGSGTWTFDRAPGGAGTNIAGSMGGALATLSQAIAVATQNNRVWCQGSETRTATLTLSLGYSGSSGVSRGFEIIGYGTSRGDGGRFTLQTSTNSVHLITYASGADSYVFQNLLLKSTAGSPGNIIQTGSSGSSLNLVLDNCRLTGGNIGINGPFSGQYFIVPLVVHNCEIDNNASHGVYNSGFFSIINSYVHENGGSGAWLHNPNQGAEGMVLSGSTFWKNGADGVTFETNTGSTDSCGVLSLNCNFVDNVANGFGGPGSDSHSTQINCVFYGNNVGINGGGTTVGVQYNNAFGNNTTADRQSYPAGAGDIALTADPFNGRTSGDFSLNSTAGGGAALKAAGFQSTVM